MRTMYLIKAVDKDTGKSLYYYNIGCEYDNFTEDIYVASLFAKEYKNDYIEEAKSCAKYKGLNNFELFVEEVTTEIKLTGKSEIIDMEDK